MSKLSVLEHVVLGIVWKRGPITTYGVRKEFLDSPSTHFSGSAGAIYPLMERLEAQKLLVSSLENKGKRPRSLYRITKKGSSLLKEWLLVPKYESSSITTYNPLRTRLYFFKALPPSSQLKFLKNAKTMVEEELSHVKRQHNQYQEMGDIYSSLASRNAALVLNAQLKWLEEVKSRLSL